MALGLAPRLAPWLLLGPLLCTTGCPAPPSPPSEPVVLGVVLPLTGPQASYGVAARSGIELAIHEANKDRPVLGRRVRAVFIDDQSDRDQAVSATQRLITKEHAHLILGEVSSSASLAMAQTAQRARTPMISPSATAPDLTKHGPFIFRACFADPFQAHVMAEYAAKDLGIKKVGIMRDLGSTYALGLAEAFEARAKALGLQVVAVTEFSAEDKDFNGPLSELGKAGAEAVYLPGYVQEVRRILSAAHQAQVKFRFLGSDGWDAPQLAQLGPAAEGQTFITHFSAQSPQAAPFVTTFSEYFNERPDTYAALGYDAANVALHAMRVAKSTDPEKVQVALSNTADFSGVTGPIRFKGGGDPSKSAVILEFKEGVPTRVREWAP